MGGENTPAFTSSPSVPFLTRYQGNGLLLGIIMPFSKHLLMLKDLRMVEPENLLYGVMTLAIDDEHELIGRLKRELGNEYQLLVEPAGEQAIALNKSASQSRYEPWIKTVSDTGLYKATLSLPRRAVYQTLQELYPVAAGFGRRADGADLFIYAFAD